MSTTSRAAPVAGRRGAAQACIEVRRTRQAIGVLRRFPILIDGDEAGAVGFGRATRLSVSPGRHRVRISQDWVRTPEVVVDLEDGDLAVLEVGMRQRGLRLLTVWLEALIRPSHILYLRPVDD